MTCIRCQQVKDEYINLEKLNIPMHDQLIDLKRKWCVAVELGPTDRTLLNFAHLVDDHLKPGEWELIHVVPGYHQMEFNYESGLMNLEFSFNQESIDRIEKLAKGFSSNGHERQVTTVIEAGDPHEQLLSNRHVGHSNHLMIGMKDASESSHKFILKLTRTHKGPVWIVPEKSSGKLKTILVPIDFSPNSIRALKNASQLVREWGAPVQIIVLHVYNPPALSASKLMRTREAYQEVLATFRNEAMEDLLRTHLGDQAKFVKHLSVERQEPGIAQYIRDAAEEVRADLVVMGAKGYSMIERLLMGSVTEKFLELNRKSVIWIIK